MQGVLEILSLDEGSSSALTVDRPIMASTVMGHRHGRQVNPITRQLHLRYCGS
jgi:hypothetical protein